MNGNFYLFTKNRSKGFDGTFLVFQVPNKEGDFEAKLIGSYNFREAIMMLPLLQLQSTVQR
jgi:hypothetical protein